MPAFKGALSDREVRALVFYIREMREKPSTTESAASRKPSANEVLRSEKHAFRLETVVDNLDTPWTLEFLSDGTLLFTERSAVKSVWSYGHRNQQGLAFHPSTGELWTSEHGPRGGDELNLTMKGKNYGWPAITFGINEDGTPITDKTAAAGMEQPAAHWTPAIAPAGIAFYTGERFPQWKHSLFIACLGGQQLRRIETGVPKVTHQEMILSGFGRVHDVTMGQDGYLYVATNAPGRILRLVPAS